MRLKNFNIRRTALIGLILVGVLAVLVITINLVVFYSGQANLYKDPNDLPATKVGLLLGAKVHRDGRLSQMMQDRADTALSAYENGKIEKILMSGDHGTSGYDEVNTVKNYLLDKGVRAEDLFLDHAGFDTYDSVYRAKAIFGVSEMTIVTQKFHLPRAVYIANSLNIKAHGLIADKRDYAGMFWNESREVLARSKAFLDITTGAKPKFLGEPISIDGDSKLSWD